MHRLFVSAIFALAIVPSTAAGQMLPEGWASSDLSAVAIMGSAAISGSTWTVTGSGVDPSEASDRYHYVYRTLTGDGIIAARVATQQNSNGWERASVMIRSTLAPGSPNASMLVTAANGLWYGRRLNSDDVTAYTFAGTETAPVWIGLMRTGQLIEAFSSSDGVNWTWIGGDTFSSMPGPVYVGLAVTSLDDSRFTTATFDGVWVTPSVTPARNGWIWAMAISRMGGGTCIEGATFEVLSGQGPIGQVITQRTPCSVWDYDGGVTFSDLTPAVAMTIRASAPGYTSVEKTLFPKTSGTVEAFLLEER
jgi:hypothetical protein